MVTPSRDPYPHTCPVPSLFLGHNTHTHWYFSKAVYRESQRFCVEGGITVARACQYSESWELSRTSFRNFTGGRESLNDNDTSANMSTWHHPGPHQCLPLTDLLLSPLSPSRSARQTCQMMGDSWEGHMLVINVPDSWCHDYLCEHRCTVLLSVSLSHWL